MNKKYYEDVDILNYYAIDYLERLGNDQPSQQEISSMERMLEFCGVVSSQQMTATLSIQHKP